MPPKWKTLFELQIISASTPNLPFVIHPDNEVQFNGDCARCTPFCAALCCQSFPVDLTEAEARSGRYQMIEMPPDPSPLPHTSSRRYFLAKTASNACVYLTEQVQCAIYEQRPNTCRQFNCAPATFVLD